MSRSVSRPKLAAGVMLAGIAFMAARDALERNRAPGEQHFYTDQAVQTTVDGLGEGKYRFTAGWHLQHVGTWAEVLAAHAGRRDLQYLEVGVFEGRSLLWMLENVLTHPSSRATAVDVFMGDYEATFDFNVEASGAGSRVSKLKGRSQDMLRTLTPGTFDIIYVDGSHTADDVLADAVLSFALLRTGGILIFDDYAWPGRRGGDPLPPELRPAAAIDAFILANRYALELLHRDYQVIVRKRDNPCHPKDYCSPVGPYQYQWRAQTLWSREGRKVELAPAEIELVECVARSRPDGQVEIRLDDALRNDPAIARLLERLELTDLLGP